MGAMLVPHLECPSRAPMWSDRMRRIGWIVVAAWLLPGCYTVLRHPAVESQEPSDVAVRADRCVACHSAWELDQFEYAFHPGWYPINGPWPGWYCEPWWIDVVAE